MSEASAANPEYEPWRPGSPYWRKNTQEGWKVDNPAWRLWLIEEELFKLAAAGKELSVGEAGWRLAITIPEMVEEVRAARLEVSPGHRFHVAPDSDAEELQAAWEGYHQPD